MIHFRGPAVSLRTIKTFISNGQVVSGVVLMIKSLTIFQKSSDGVWSILHLKMTECCPCFCVFLCSVILTAINISDFCDIA